MPSVGDNGIAAQLQRVAYTSLPGVAAKPGNIDISVNGAIALLTNETIHILIPNLGFTPILKSLKRLKHHQDSTSELPLFHLPINIKTLPPDFSRAGSGRTANLLAYQPRFLDAKWSPTDFGHLSSPVLAALTTQGQIHLYQADENQFQGPWKIAASLSGEVTEEILSFTWLGGAERCAMLVAGTRGGSLLTWMITRENSELVPKQTDSTWLLQGPVTGLAYDSADLDYLAVVTPKGISLARLSSPSTGLDRVQLMNHQPRPLDGSMTTLLCWHDSMLVYCTPGQVHIYNMDTKKTGSILLESGSREQDCSLRPAAAIVPMLAGGWQLTLQDGSIYHIFEEDSGEASEFSKPIAYLSPPNEAIGPLQEKVEAIRGVTARVDDGNSGLTFTCHDGNSIASWAYHRDPECHFGVSFTNQISPDQEVSIAVHFIDCALKGSEKHRRALILYYHQTSKKSELLSALVHALQRGAGEAQHLQAALRLSSWLLQLDPGSKDIKEKGRAALHQTLFEKSLMTSVDARLLRLLLYVDLQKRSDHDYIAGNIDVQYCKLLSKVVYALKQRHATGLLELSKKIDLLKAAISQKIDEAEDYRVGIGETCPACGASVLFDPQAILQARCEKGHRWKRCATSFALLTTSNNLTCSICSSESLRPADAPNFLQRHLLESISACDLCSGKLFL